MCVEFQTSTGFLKSRASLQMHHSAFYPIGHKHFHSFTINSLAKQHRQTHTHPILATVMEATSSEERYETVHSSPPSTPSSPSQHAHAQALRRHIPATIRAGARALIPSEVDVKGAWPGLPRLSSISTSSSPCPQQLGHTCLGRNRGRGERSRGTGLAESDVT